MRRVVVVGNSGSGKTTLSRALAAALDVPHVELDALFHQAGWQPLPPEQFRERVGERVRADGWVVDGNYSVVADLVWARADTVVWLDPSRARVMRQVLGRTVRRLVLRHRLWNGNRERWTNLLSVDPERSVVAWAWTRHREYRERYRAAMADPANRRLRFVRVATAAQARALLAEAAQR